MCALVRAGVLGGARPFSIPPRGRDGGEVMRSWVVYGEGRGERGEVVADSLSRHST
jgi:hypothetical protein